VWKRGYFGWEYKGKHKDVIDAYAQLQRYAVALENPPLLVVSDMETLIVASFGRQSYSLSLITVAAHPPPLDAS